MESGSPLGRTHSLRMRIPSSSSGNSVRIDSGLPIALAQTHSGRFDDNYDDDDVVAPSASPFNGTNSLMINASQVHPPVKWKMYYNNLNSQGKPSPFYYFHPSSGRSDPNRTVYEDPRKIDETAEVEPIVYEDDPSIVWVQIPLPYQYYYNLITGEEKEELTDADGQFIPISHLAAQENKRNRLDFLKGKHNFGKVMGNKTVAGKAFEDLASRPDTPALSLSDPKYLRDLFSGGKKRKTKNKNNRIKRQTKRRRNVKKTRRVRR